MDVRKEPFDTWTHGGYKVKNKISYTGLKKKNLLPNILATKMNHTRRSFVAPGQKEEKYCTQICNLKVRYHPLQKSNGWLPI